MKRKILIFIASVILLSIVITSIITLIFVKEQYLNQIESRLISNCRLINDYILQSDMNTIDFSGYAYNLSRELDARITFINIEGVVIGDSEVDKSKLPQIENHRYREEVKEALAGEIGKGIRESSTIGIDYMYIAVALEKDGSIYGVTRIALPLYELNKLYGQIRATIFFGAIMALISAISLSILYSGKVTRPIRNLTEYAQKIADGYYNQKIYIKTGDEIELLGNTFNEMSERLDSSIKQLEENNSKLSSILFSMKEAIIAIDMEYRLIMVNQAAKELFYIDDDAIGQHLLKVIRDKRLLSVFQSLIQEKYIGEQEINYGDEDILKIRTSYIMSEGNNNKIGVLALIENITQIKKLENMRKDFAANVSHELKTPLTSISGFIETLQGGAAENTEVRNRFLDIISIETARLKRLIEDILILSDIESGRILDTNEIVDVKKAIQDALVLLENEIDKKNIKVLKHYPDEDMCMKNSNMDRFKQMLLNIIDNAIKYSFENGEIDISLTKEGNRCIIQVKDKGPGIAAEHISRLFERFYRVDEARSKKVGGTGLGLAIVKHIVILFKGTIRVESKENEGTTFIITLPL